MQACWLHLSFLVILLSSWLAFAWASSSDTLVYLPLKSFFLPIELEQGSKFCGLGLDFLTRKNLDPDFINKLVHEISMWLIVLSLGYGFIRRPQLDIKTTRNLALILAGIAALILPADSSDIYGYIARGWQQVAYDANPFASVVADIERWRDVAMLKNTLWQHNPSPYGPLFMLIAKTLTWLAAGNLWLAILFFKLLNFGIFAAGLILLEKILLEWQIKSVNWLYAAFALNPFVIAESLWNGHNDLLMGLGILLSLYLASRSNFFASILVLSLVTMVKYISLVLLPLIVLLAIKESKWFELLGGLALSSLIAWLLISHYDLLSLDYSSISKNISLSHKSLFDSLNSLFKYLGGGDLPQTLRWLFLAGFGGYSLITYFRFFKDSRPDIFRASFWLILVLLLIASPKFHSWYLLMLIPVGMLVEPGLMLLLSLTHLLSLTLLDQANIVNYLLMTVLPCALYFSKQSHRLLAKLGLRYK